MKDFEKKEQELLDMAHKEANIKLRKVYLEFDRKLSFHSGKKERLKDVIMKELDYSQNKYAQLYLFLNCVVFIIFVLGAYIVSPVYAVLTGILMLAGTVIVVELLLLMKVKTKEITKQDRECRKALIKNKKRLIVNTLNSRNISEDLKVKYKEIYGKDVSTYKDIANFDIT